jgi:ribose-phosphate pyrophosphokinase
LSYFTIPVKNISSIPLLADYARDVLKLSNPLIVSPDFGGITRAAEFARLLKTDMIYFEKSRDLSTGEVIIKNEKHTHEYKKKLEGRDVLLIDDMISSGRTIAKACDFIKKNGANKVHALCVHALLGTGIAQRMKTSGIQDIIATNSIPNEFARVDLSPLLLDTLNKIIR